MYEEPVDLEELGGKIWPRGARTSTPPGATRTPDSSQKSPKSQMNSNQTSVELEAKIRSASRQQSVQRRGNNPSRTKGEFVKKEGVTLCFGGCPSMSTDLCLELEWIFASSSNGCLPRARTEFCFELDGPTRMGGEVRFPHDGHRVPKLARH